MRVECPYKDWEGDSALLSIHLFEVHKIIGSNPIPTIEQTNKLTKKKDFFMEHLNENLNSKFFWITIVAFFILGVIFANSV